MFKVEDPSKSRKGTEQEIKENFLTGEFSEAGDSEKSWKMNASQENDNEINYEDPGSVKVGHGHLRSLTP